MRTTVAIALLGLVAAVAPPRIELSLNEQSFPGVGVDSSVTCEAGASNSKNCPVPVATAYDHHDRVCGRAANSPCKLNQTVWTMEGDRPVEKCNTWKNCKNVIDYSKPGEWLFLFDAVDSAGNWAERKSTNSLEGETGTHTASVTFNLILKDDIAPVICYGQQVSQYSATHEHQQINQGTGATGTQTEVYLSGRCPWNHGFRNETDQVMTVEGGSGTFNLKPSYVHDNVTPRNRMAIHYTVARCQGKSVSSNPDEILSEPGTQGALDCTQHKKVFTEADGSTEKQRLNRVNRYIQKFISGACPKGRDGRNSPSPCKAAGYLQVKLDSKDDAGIYGHNDQDNKAETVMIAIKIVDTVKPSIVLNGATPITVECDWSKTYTDLGASATDDVDPNPTLTVNENLTNAVYKVKQYRHGGPYKGLAVNGTYSVKWSAVDYSGNQAMEVRTVEVIDNKAPTLELAGSHQVITYETNKPRPALQDPGVTNIRDKCDQDIGTQQVTMTWGNKPFNERAIGTYTRTYTVTDAVGLVSAPVTRKFYVVDLEAPTVTPVGRDSITLEASHEQEYKDKGATCEDFVDGVLNHRVRVGGDIVDMTIPNTYHIDYTCEDLSGNHASYTRTVIVQDTTAPHIRITGPNLVRVEAGFPYVEQGATATDTLDGNIKPCGQQADSSIVGTHNPSIVGAENHVEERANHCLHTYGNSVNEFWEYHVRPSCADIKQALTQSNLPVKSGRYSVTRDVNNQEVNFPVECNMETAPASTYWLAQPGRLMAEHERKQFCEDNSFAYPRAADGRSRLDNNIDRIFLSKVYPDDAKLQSIVPPTDRTISTSEFLCIDDSPTTGGNVLTTKDCEEITDENIHRCTRAGQYTVTYWTRDHANNAASAQRTVIVEDTLPPVISLHFQSKSTNGLDRVIQRSRGGKGINGENNPARTRRFNVNLARYPVSQIDADSITPGWKSHTQTYSVVHDSNPTHYEGPFMAETSVSLNGWLVAAAASAVAGMALLAASSKRTVASVPV